MFDPYHKWLGIPRGPRPPTWYQLLGISPEETDGEVIKEAALRQTGHVRTYQTGPHAEDCTRLLNEIGQARATLLNPEARRQYDASLPRTIPPAAAVAEPAPPPARAPLPPARAPEPSPPPSPLEPPAASWRRRGRGSWQETPALVGYIGLLLLGGVTTFWLTSQHLERTAERPLTPPSSAKREGGVKRPEQSGASTRPPSSARPPRETRR